LVVTVNNVAPQAANDTGTGFEDTVFMVASPGVLGNDTDVPADVLTAGVVQGPAHGTLTLNADGSFTYQPAADFNGADAFTYRVTDDDGGVSNVATVLLTVAPVNDAPHFTKSADQSVSEDAGPQTVLGAATGISAGAGNE